MLGTEWLWRRTLPAQATSVLQYQLGDLRARCEKFPDRRRKYDRMISAIVYELARRSADSFTSVYAKNEEPMVPTRPPASGDPKGRLAQLFSDALRRQQSKFAGRVHSETDERSVRLVALIDATFEFQKATVPALEVALADPTNRRNAAQKLSLEYMPLLMLDPEELPRAFAEYTLWQYGDERGSPTADVEYLKRIFREGIGRLPEKTQEAAIKSKHEYEWGKLV